MVENTAEQLTLEDIREWCSSNHIYQRGAQYYIKGHVQRLMYWQDTREWEASVKGTQYYDVYVDFDEEWLDGYCDCPAFQKYDTCKHVVAVMLAIRNQQKYNGTQRKSSGQSPRYRFARDMINSFVNHPEAAQEEYFTQNKQPLQVDYILKKQLSASFYTRQPLLALEFKVGVHRTYVVKDIRKFLRNVKDQSTHFFTKKFTYDPNEHYFDEEDWAVIEVLLKMLEQEQFGQVFSSPWHAYTSGHDERAMPVPPLFAEELFQKLSSRPVMVDMDGVVHKQGLVVQEEGRLPFSFQLEKEDNSDFKLDLHGLQEGIFFEAYGFFFYKGTFYKLSSEQQSVIQNLLGFRHPSTEGSMLVNYQQMEPLVSHVIPALNKIGEVQLADNVSEQIENPPLEAKVFIDRDEDQLTVQIEYHYGDMSINPFQADAGQRDKILMRDAEREQQLMAIFESAPMHYNGSKCSVDGEEDLYDFLYQTVPALEDKAEIYMTQAVRSMFLAEQQTPTTSIDVDHDGSLLEIDFDMEGIDSGEVQHILQSVVEKKRYYRLPDGTFVSLEDEAFQQVNQLLNELNISPSQTDSTMKVPVHRGLQIEGVMQEAGHDSFKTGKAFRRLVQDIKNPDTVDYALPEGLQATLRDYQEFGYQWLKTLARYHLGGILADDMGLGKTLQSIAYLLSEKEQNASDKPSLIVVPASVVYNWKNEFDKFAPAMKVGVAYGAPQERSKIFDDGTYDVWITSYSLLRADSDRYAEQTFDTLVLDEAQAIKNRTTKTAKTVKEITAGKRFALSGTPIENALDELWSIFDAIMPGFFGDPKAFKNLSQERITQMARPFILRRMKQDVLKELPDKIETVYETELTKEQKQLYLGYLGRIQQETKQSIEQEGFQKNRMKILAGLTRLRQLCCHPSLFLENYEGKSGKLEQLMEMVQNARENGQRMLIFSQFASMLQMIRNRLQQENINCFYLDGSTPSQDRITMMERFNAGEKEIFLVSLKAGGTGLNLTGADTVILYDLWWNPAVEEQAAGRAHRIGQKNVVQVMRVIARGTIEEKIYDMQQKKKELIEQVVQPGETMLTAMSEDEIRDILEI